MTEAEIKVLKMLRRLIEICEDEQDKETDLVRTVDFWAIAEVCYEQIKEFKIHIGNRLMEEYELSGKHQADKKKR